jgi:hypothetical protein
LNLNLNKYNVVCLEVYNSKVFHFEISYQSNFNIGFSVS